MAKRMQYNPPKLTCDEATKLCVYHLRMATALFQLVPDDGNKALRAEILRQCKDGIDEIDVQPAMLWAAALFTAYEKMKERD